MTEPAVTLPSSVGSAALGELFGGRYRLARVLGRGGMGTVFHARDLVLDREVALKILAPELAANPEFALRLTREAKAVARLRSDHVVRVMDVDTLDGVGPCMVMEYLRGRSLGEEVEERGPLPVAEVVAYMLAALDALAEAHAMGIVHRDLKPSNLFLAELVDGRRCIKVLDFGISKFELLSEPTHDLTSSRALLGTPLYMSPEQLRNPKEVDARADVWSLGVVMYQLLTAKTPFEGATVGEVCFSIAETAPRPMRAFRGDIPPSLDRTVLRCLRRLSSERFADAADLRRALAPFGRVHATGRFSNWASKKRKQLAAVSTAVAVLGGWGWSRRGSLSEPIKTAESGQDPLQAVPSSPSSSAAPWREPLASASARPPSTPVAPVPARRSRPKPTPSAGVWPDLDVRH